MTRAARQPARRATSWAATVATWALVAGCTGDAGAGASQLIEPPAETPFAWEFEPADPYGAELPDVVSLGSATDLDLSVVGIDVVEGTAALHPAGLEVEDPVAGALVAAEPSPDVRRIAIIRAGQQVGQVSLSALDSSLALDIDPANPGFEYVQAPFHREDGVRLSTPAAAVMGELLARRGASALCLLPGSVDGRSRAPADEEWEVTCESTPPAAAASSVAPPTTAPAVWRGSSGAAASRPASTMLPPPGRCPTPPDRLDEQIDRLRLEAQRAFGLRHDDLVDLLSDRTYWRNVLSTTVEVATGVPPDGDVFKFVENMLGQAGTNDRLLGEFRKALSSALFQLLTGPGRYATKAERDAAVKLQRALKIESLRHGLDDQRRAGKLAGNLAELVEGSYGYGIIDGDRIDANLTEWEETHLDAINAALGDADDALAGGLLSEPTPADLAKAYEHYDAALAAFEAATGRPFSHGALSGQCSPTPDSPGTSSSSVKGEPHLATFDGLHYDFQAAGEFVLFGSSIGDMEVHVRFLPPPGTRDATFAQAWGVRIGAVTVQGAIDLPGVLVDGESMSLSDGQRVAVGPGWLLRRGADTVVQWPDGSEVVFGEQMVGLPIQASVSKLRGGTLSGLLGDADGAREGELRTAQGESIAGPLDPDWIHGPFADSWRVTDQDSLLFYRPGESTADFTDRSVPGEPLTFASFDPAVVDEALTTCLDGGLIAEPHLENCVFDHAATGDEGFVAQAARSQSQSVDVVDVSTSFEDRDSIVVSGGVLVDVDTGEWIGEAPGLGDVRPERSADLIGVQLAAGEGLAMEAMAGAEWECDLGPEEDTPLLARLVGADGRPVTDFVDLRTNCSRQALYAPAAAAGTYWVQIGSPVQDSWNLWPTGAAHRPYVVALSKVPPLQTFEASLGDTLEPDAQGPGSGVIETVFAADTYDVPLESGEDLEVVLHEANGQCSFGPGPGFTVSATFEDGRAVSDGNGQPLAPLLTDNCGLDPGARVALAFTAPETGTYTIAIRGDYLLGSIWGDEGGARSGTYRVTLR